MDEEEAFAYTIHAAALVGVGGLVGFFKFVHDDSVLVHGRG